MKTLKQSSAQALVDVSLDVPDEVTYTGVLVPNLGYPVEVAGFSNVPLAQREDERGIPRGDLLPARGILLWLVAYDDRFELETQFTPSKDGGQKSGIKKLGPADEGESWWDNVRLWTRDERIGPHKSCQIFAFAGTSDFAPTSYLSTMVTSLDIKT